MRTAFKVAKLCACAYSHKNDAVRTARKDNDQLEIDERTVSYGLVKYES